MYKLGQSGQLDPDIIARLVNVIGVYPLNSAVLLTSSEKAVVIKNNRSHPLKPIVRICYQASGEKYQSPITKDLNNQKSTTEDISIDKILDTSIPGIDPQGLLHEN